MKNSKVRFSHAELERIAEWEMEHHGVIRMSRMSEKDWRTVEKDLVKFYVT